MRISYWSSDVCSSDLTSNYDDLHWLVFPNRMRRALAVPLRLGPAMEGGRPERCATRYTNVVPHQSLGTSPMIDLGPSRCCGAPLYGYVVRGPVKGAVCFLTAPGERRFPAGNTAWRESVVPYV